MTQSKTLIGGSLTILMYLSLLSIFYISAMDVINHKNAQVTLNSEIAIERDPILLDAEHMPISVFVSQNISIPLNKPEYFSFSYIVFSGGTSDESLNRTKLNSTKCTADNFPGLPYEYFWSYSLEQNVCIKDQNVTISGSWIDYTVTYLSARVSLCKNHTWSNITCAPEEEIMNFLKNNPIYFNVMFKDSIMNPSNYDSPFTSIINYYYTTIKIGSHKILNLLIKNQSLHSDDGLIFKTHNFYEAPSFDYSYLDDANYENEKVFVEMIFSVSPNQIKYIRRYMKIQEVLASVGGLANVLKIVFTLVCFIFSKMQRDEFLLNEIFDFDVMKKEISQPVKIIPHSHGAHSVEDKDKISSININDDVKSVSKSENNLAFSFSSNLDINPSTIRSPKRLSVFNREKENNAIKINLQNPQEVIKLLEQRKSKYTLKFSNWEIIKTAVCCGCCHTQKLNDKLKLYNKSKNFILNYMDISYIMKKLEEFEKLKIVIFNPEQLALFNFIAKEFISISEENIKKHNLTRMKTFVNNKEDLANIIINFRNKIYSSDTKVKHSDKKLYDLISEDLK